MGILSTIKTQGIMEMGNVVIMAVRHRNLDQVAEHLLKDIDYQINNHDLLPKPFDRPDPWDIYGVPGAENVVFSQYTHSSGILQVYVDGDMMLGVPVGQNKSQSQQEKITYDFEYDLKDLRSQLRAEKMSLLNKKSKVSRPAKEGDKVSLFLLYTDNLTRIEDKPQLMKDVVEYCRTGVQSRLIGGINDGITAIGTVAENEAAIVRVHGYAAQLQVMPRFEVQFDPAECEMIRAIHQDRDYAKSIRAMKHMFLRELAGANGYLLEKKKPKAVQTPG